MFCGFRKVKIINLTIRPPRKSIPTETRHLAQKRCRSVHKKMWSPEAGKNPIKYNDKFQNNRVSQSHFTPLSDRPCWDDFTLF